MSDERIDDETVSAGYRELASERTPAHLDQQVLRMAANHVEHAAYTRSISWTRPLAWAATVAICLAITLQITRVPEPEEIVNAPLSPELPAARRPLSDMPAAEQSRANELAPAAAKATEKMEPSAAGSSSMHREADLAEAPRRARDDDAATPAASFEFKIMDSNAWRQAEEIAQLQNGTNLTQRASSPACTEEERAKPESWLQCIEKLEEIGDQQTAVLERKSLVAVFPEFRLP